MRIIKWNMMNRKMKIENRMNVKKKENQKIEGENEYGDMKIE